MMDCSKDQIETFLAKSTQRTGSAVVLELSRIQSGDKGGISSRKSSRATTFEMLKRCCEIKAAQSSNDFPPRLVTNFMATQFIVSSCLIKHAKRSLWILAVFTLSPLLQGGLGTSTIIILLQKHSAYVVLYLTQLDMKNMATA
jgi:hypothetical protein